eukprot:scaffold1435_cov267-Pinguiococcus_pyrenoidosus.AAC.51
MCEGLSLSAQRSRVSGSLCMPSSCGRIASGSLPDDVGVIPKSFPKLVVQHKVQSSSHVVLCRTAQHAMLANSALKDPQTGPPAERRQQQFQRSHERKVHPDVGLRHGLLVTRILVVALPDPLRLDAKLQRQCPQNLQRIALERPREFLAEGVLQRLECHCAYLRRRISCQEQPGAQQTGQPASDCLSIGLH